MIRRALATAIAVGVLGASTPVEGSEPVVDPPSADPIVGGVPTEPDELDAVVAFYNSEGRMCSGTLVTTELVLTAAHCLVEHREGSPIRVFFGPDTDGAWMDAIDYGTHPSFCEYCQEEAWDYAYISLPEAYEPADGVLLPITNQAEWDETMREGRVVLLAGFGTDDPNSNGILREELKRKVTTTIARFTDNAFELFAGGNFRDTCPGDSGGPAVVVLGNGTRRLGAVTSRGSDPCGSGGYYGVPFVALPWLRDETGVDLLPPGCPFADCLDLLPPAEEGCCSIGTRGGSSPTAALLLLLLAGLVRRRRGRRGHPRATS